jgi:hypothetical protein
MNLVQLGADSGLDPNSQLCRDLQAAIRGTLYQSLDAMLEWRDDLTVPGKMLIATLLLQWENKVLHAPTYSDESWYELIWDACDLGSLDSFRATPLTIISYNYDRYFEYRLIESLRERFRRSEQDCAQALDCIGPIHLHGQLGFLPGFGESVLRTVAFGSSPAEFATDCLRAATSIQIVHEANPLGDAFARAQSAIAAAERVIFLGFGYAKTNVERLRLPDCMKPTTKLYLCVKGYTLEELNTHILPRLNKWPIGGMGRGAEDIVQFFRRFPEALL